MFFLNGQHEVQGIREIEDVRELLLLGTILLTYLLIYLLTYLLTYSMEQSPS
jgi:hypothetical protein